MLSFSFINVFLFQTGIFMFSATISGFFGVIMIPWYYIVAAMHSNVESNSGNDELFDTEIALSVTITCLGLFVAWIGIRATVLFVKLCGHVDSNQKVRLLNDT